MTEMHGCVLNGGESQVVTSKVQFVFLKRTIRIHRLSNQISRTDLCLLQPLRDVPMRSTSQGLCVASIGMKCPPNRTSKSAAV